MARSIGEAAAVGLTSGYDLALRTADFQARREREQRLDAAAEDESTYRRQRQQNADAVAALDAQGKMLTQEGISLANSKDPIAQEDYTRRFQEHNRVKSELLSKISGYDFAKEQKRGTEDIERLRAGETDGINITRVANVATGRPVSDYLRADGQPSVVDTAVEDLMSGLEGGDQTRMLNGINILYAPELRKGVGTKSPHGGVIVGKTIVGLDPHPSSKDDDPAVVPRIRVWVKGDKDYSGPPIPGAPEGATGYYDAPLTKNRSSDPNDMVLPISLNQTLERVEKHLQFGQLLNSPEVMAKIQQEMADGDFDEAAFQQALRQQGIIGGKTTTKNTPLSRFGLLQERVDAQGNVVSSQVIKPEGGAAATGPASKLEAQLAAIDEAEEAGEITPKQANIERRAARSGIKPGKYTGDAPAGGGGGGGGESLKERELKRKELKDEYERADKNADNAQSALRDFRAANKFPPPASRNGGADRRAYEEELAALTEKAKKARARADKLSAKLDDPEGEPAKPAAAPAAGPRKTIKALPEGAKLIGTSGGKKVYQTPDGRKFKED